MRIRQDEIKEEEKYLHLLPIEDKVKLNYALSKNDVLSPEGLLLIECLSRDKGTLHEVASILNISDATFLKWRKQHPELEEACKKGKMIVDYQVENALLKAALGYTTKTVKTTISKTPDQYGNLKHQVERTLTEVGPNVTACLAWLNNRKPDQWRRNKDSVLEMDDKENGITINIVKGKKEEDD